jgi:hypothetical protein
MKWMQGMMQKRNSPQNQPKLLLDYQADQQVAKTGPKQHQYKMQAA